MQPDRRLLQHAGDLCRRQLPVIELTSLPSVLKTRTGKPRSRLISSLLTGAWRETPAAPEISAEELVIIAPLLIASGGGAMAFWKLRGTPLESTQAAADLKQVYRLYTLHAVVHEREIQQVIKLLSREGIDHILVKGWSMARVYPEPALRPYGDIDLFVRPEQFALAEKIMGSIEGRKFFVDLHKGADHLDEQIGRASCRERV